MTLIFRQITLRTNIRKLDIYKRISAIENEEEFDMRDELIDRFGDIPRSVENLLTIAAIKSMAHQVYVTEAVIGRREFKLTLYPKAKLDPAGISEAVTAFKGALTLTMGEAPVLSYRERKPKQGGQPLIEPVKEVLRILLPYSDCSQGAGEKA